jgi:hypothetical protein
MIDEFTDDFSQFYNPTVEDTPSGLTPATIAWPAFPARVEREEGPGAARCPWTGSSSPDWSRRPTSRGTPCPPFVSGSA